MNSGLNHVKSIIFRQTHAQLESFHWPLPQIVVNEFKPRRPDDAEFSAAAGDQGTLATSPGS
jgi:hypothetical protein